MASVQIQSSPSTISSHVQEEEEVMMTEEEIEAMKKSIYKNATKRLWNDVLTEYRKPENQELKITRLGDTILHLAVLDGKLKIVRQLVKLISDDNVSKILKLKNNRGDTVLHIATAMGYVEMCECIVGRDRSLIGERNDDGETPLFLAASLGKKEAFVFLHSRCGSICRGTNGLPYWRRLDGETVLHCAINGESFDLAYLLIQIYGDDLVHCKNEKGLSPLHILASKPNVFKSGNFLGLLDRLIYRCIFVGNPDSYPIKYRTYTSGAMNFYEENVSKFFPKKYRICLLFSRMLRKLAMVIDCCVSALPIRNQKTDMENPELVQETCAGNTMAFRPPSPKMYLPTVWLKLAMTTLFWFFPSSSRPYKTKKTKEKITWATIIMEELIERASGNWEYETYAVKLVLQSQHDHIEPGETTVPFNADDLQTSIPPPNAAAYPPPQETKAKKGEEKIESPILIAAKMGVIEMVEKLLDKFPLAIQDVNAQKKNIVLLAVENRQSHVYERILRRTDRLHRSVFEQLDNKGNSVLHLAATLGESRPWLIPGAALQMQSEIKWYKFVKDSVLNNNVYKPLNLSGHLNNEGKTAKQVFSETHKELVKEGGEWLTNTSQSCSVVAALIASVAFATATTVPGGLDSTSGAPTFATKPAFKAFTISSLAALCFSVTSMIMFLSILTSGYEENNFAKDLPNKLNVALSSLVLSIVSMLVTFCVGQVFVLNSDLIRVAYAFYVLTSLPVAFFMMRQFPIIDMIRESRRFVPQRSHNTPLASEVTSIIDS